MKSKIKSVFKYIREHKLPLLVSLISVSLVIPPLPSSYALYYAVLVVLFIFSFTRKNFKFNFLIIWFYVAALLSILLGNPDPVFKSYARLGLFILLTGAVFPLFDSFEGNKFRFRLCSASIKVCILVGIISFFCYFLGINYMVSEWGNMSINTVGIFGGITNQSMMLAPICMIGIIYLTTNLLYVHNYRKVKIILVIALAIAILITASRSAFVASIIGCLIALIIRYWDRKVKVLKVLTTVVLIGIITYPLYGDFSTALTEKQSSNEEMGGTFASRDVKWNARITEFSNNPFTGIGYASVDWNLEPDSRNPDGVVEPGSTWLSVLSMTGIFGAIPITLLLFTSLRRIFRFSTLHKDFNSCVLVSIVVAQIVHQFAEGYGLAAGSFLCYLFWLFLGATYSYPSLYLKLKDNYFKIENL